MTDNETLTKAELLPLIEKGWDEFQAYLSTLSEEQLTTPTDSAGWTAKDHIIHLAMWEDGIYALFQGQLRHEYMGIPKATWDTHNYDQINAIIFERCKDMPLDEVLSTFRRVHERLFNHVQSMSDEDLHQPYRHYQPDSTQDGPAINWVSGDTYDHYAAHRPWIEAIVR
jgi:hypothetical protein